MTVVLMLPAIVVTVCFFLILFGIERDPGTARRPASTSSASASSPT